MKNNKGFMMAEVIVVSAMVMTLLGTIYTSYNKLYNVYSSRITYYDAGIIYELAYYRDSLIEADANKNLNAALKDGTLNKEPNNKGGCIKVSNYLASINANETVFLIKNKEKQLTDKIINNCSSLVTNINPTFQDYLNYLKESEVLIYPKENKSNYIMVMEKCNNTNKDDCKYGYLEIFDGYEKQEE